MSVKEEKITEYNGEQIYSYTLTNRNGLCAEILNYGGIIKRLIFKNTDVVLGKDTIDEYIDNNDYFGAIIGRNSNCIENAEFELDGKIYKLSANDGKNNLHGGSLGFNKKVWKPRIEDGDEPSLILSAISFDGEEGFPGKVKVQVTYTVTEDNSIRIDYTGEADRDTVLNMTSHSYFNLNGHASGSIDGHSLWIASDFYTPVNDALIPDGEILSVRNTPFDFSTGESLGERFKSNHEQIKKIGGFDHNFVLCGDKFQMAAKLRGEKTGIIMEVYTDRPGIQLYSANEISDGCAGKGGAVYCRHSAVCLETQAFPNGLKFPHFRDGILRKGEKFSSSTSYKFI